MSTTPTPSANGRGLLSTPGQMTARMNAASMGMFAFAVFFGTLASVGIGGVARQVSTPWVVGLVLVLAAIVAAGAARSRWGLLVSAVVLAAVFLASFTIYGGPVVVAMFAAMWAWLVWVGRKIDQDRADIPAGSDD